MIAWKRAHGALVVCCFVVPCAIGCGMAQERYGAAKAPPSTPVRGPAAQTVGTASVDRDGDAMEDEAEAAPAEPYAGGGKTVSEARHEFGMPAPASAPTGAPSPPPPSSIAVASTTEKDGTLLVYTAQLTMAVYQVESNVAAVERLARQAGGYLAQRADARITVRVPRARFDDVLKACEALGDVVHRDVAAEDVTDRYVELETRLRNARAMRDRLVQLLERAPVKEAIEIERELGRVTGEIESLEGKLKLLRDKVA